MTAFLVINAERDHIATESDQLVRKQGVTEAYSVSGDFDIALVRVKASDDLVKMVTQDCESSRIMQNQDIGRVQLLQQL
jgi:hypothetical protein